MTQATVTPTCATTKKIDYRFKILQAVAITMIVAIHCNGGGISLSFNRFFPYGVSIALFIFTSGYFYKPSAEENCWKYVITKAKHLLLPLYIYNIVYGFLVTWSHSWGFSIGKDLSLYNLFISPITDGHAFAYNLGGWFIIPLFLTQVFYAALRKICKKHVRKNFEWFCFCLSILLGIVGNTLACHGYNAAGPWLVLVRMLYFLPYYACGYFYRIYLERYDMSIPSTLYIVSLFAIKFLLILILGKSPNYTAAWCNDFYEGPVMPIFIGFLGVALWMRIATLLNPLLGKNIIIGILSKNTYSIMINQFLGFMLVKELFFVLSKYNILKGFDEVAYKSDLWYYYIPDNFDVNNIFYLAAGLGVPIVVQMGIDRAKAGLAPAMRRIAGRGGA